MTTPSGTTRYTCPLPGCGWSQDIHTSDQATALMDLELAMRIHVDDHSPLEYLRALTTAQDTWKASAGILEAEGRLRAELGTATRHAHTVDAERAETEAALLIAQAEVQRARAREARARAEAVTAQAALDAVRRLCNLTIDASVRAQAIEQARDTLTVIDRITAEAAPESIRTAALHEAAAAIQAVIDADRAKFPARSNDRAALGGARQIVLNLLEFEA